LDQRKNFLFIDKFSSQESQDFIFFFTTAQFWKKPKRVWRTVSVNYSGQISGREKKVEQTSNKSPTRQEMNANKNHNNETTKNKTRDGSRPRHFLF
jgi:hypothetical protein